jgi:very-short-patch-repair endonuclease
MVEQVDARVARVAARQWGIVDVHDLRACGLSDDAIRIRVRAGRLFPKYRGVYAVGHPNISLEGLFLAAVKACGPDAVLSHYAAGALYRLVKWDGRYPEVTAPTLRRHPGILTHRSQDIERAFYKGIPITPPARALIDLSSVLPFKPLRRAVNEALNQRLITPAQLVTSHHRGAKQLRQILATAAPTRSELEDVVLALLSGLPTPDVNKPLNGHRYIPDFRWPGHRLIVEADSRRFHDHMLARADDAARQAYLEATGERFLRVTWLQATTQPTQTRARIEAALRSGVL